jgi:hypothetical protein
VFLLLGYGLFDCRATFRAKAVTLPQPCTTLIAGEPYPCCKVLDGNGPSVKVDITYVDTQSLGDATAKVKKQPNKKPISQVLSCFFQFLYFCWFKIRLGHRLRS